MPDPWEMCFYHARDFFSDIYISKNMYPLLVTLWPMIEADVLPYMYIYIQEIYTVHIYIHIHYIFFSVVEGVHGPPGPRQRFLTQRARP